MTGSAAADCPAELVAFADDLADVSGGILRRWFRQEISVDNKPDQTPVTEVDRAAETALRERIAEAWPDHGILGEEHGGDSLQAEFVWVIDPIDGTKRFITGQPLFGTLIALARGGAPILGVIDMPILNERWIGAAGRPTLNRWAGATRKVRTRACPRIADAVVTATSPHMFEGADEAAFERVRRAARFPLYGGECYAYGLVASGSLDLVVEADLGVYDYLAQVPIIEGAGGVISDWQGGAPTLGSGDKIVAAGDARLHEQALALLAGD